MESYHQQVIERMKSNSELPDEIRQTADKLLNGATARYGPFSPRDFGREQREESVFLAEVNRVLEAKNAEKDKQIEDKDKKIEQLTSNATAMQEEFDRKKAFLQKKLNEAKAEAKEAKALANEAVDMVEELQAQEIHFRREISRLRTKISKIVLDLKEVAKKAVEDALAQFVPLLRRARNRAEEEDVEMKAKASISGAILHPVAELEAEASSLLEADTARDVNLSMFVITPQRYGYAVSQIKKAAQGTRYEE